MSIRPYAAFLTRLCSAIGFICSIAACASTEYSTYEGNAIRTGTGGTKKVVEGIDIWDSGSPPRKFKVLGVVRDSRSTGPLGQMNFYKTLAAQARAQGGDAVIIVGSRVRHTGSFTTPVTASATTSGTATANGPFVNYTSNTSVYYDGGDQIDLYKRDTGVLVVKYLP